MKAIKELASILLRVAISIALLIFLFKFNRIEVGDVLAVIAASDKGYLFLGFLVASLVFVLGFFRWEMLLKASHIYLPGKRVAIAFGGGAFFSLFLPSTIGGDLTRTLDLAAHTKRPREIVATVFMDRLSGYVGLVLIAIFMLIFGWRYVWEYTEVILGIMVLTFVLLAVLVVLFNKPLYRRIKRMRVPGAGRIREVLTSLHAEIHLFRHKKEVLVNNLILSVLIQAVLPLVGFIVSRSLGIKIHPLYFFLFLPVINAVSLLPVSIGGLGIRESMTVFLFANVGLSKDIALSMSLIQFFFLVVYSCIGGLIYVFSVRYRRIQHHKEPGVHQDT
ncbi:MAG: flippase-like domain-containing protein [Candidatus Omnitrophica bacterium]|nr:flippase-like domain-containing protein [Candidatus Omnitrophota bacterium]